jgi:hypothetical protein
MKLKIFCTTKEMVLNGRPFLKEMNSQNGRKSLLAIHQTRD